MDGIFFEFPLSALIFIRDDRSRLDYIISWCIITLANSLSEGSHKERVVSACSHLGISGSNYVTRMNRYSELNDFLMRQENIYGKQPYCRAGKKLIFETRDGLFDLNQFKNLCAISSIIGKRKKFVRITYERLGYRMQGFKNKEMFNQFKDKIEILSYKRLRRLIEILHAKKFFSKFTYANRQMFFSTRLSDDELRESVKRSKIYWAKRKQSLEDRNYSLEIKGELEKMLLEERTLRESERLNIERVKIYRMKRVS